MTPVTMKGSKHIGFFLMTVVLAMATMVHARPVGEEPWDRYLDKGTGFYFEGQPDSAKYYLQPVFENGSDQKTTAARYLLDIALNEGDTQKINEYALFLADNYDLSITHERQKSHRRMVVIVLTALLLLLAMGWMIILGHRRHRQAQATLVEEQQREREAFDRQLDEAQTAIKEKTQEDLLKQTHEIFSHGNPRRRILDAFNAAYPHAYERLKATYPDLSEQECDLLVLNFLEFRIKEEAEILDLSQNTVMKYRSNLLKKVGKDPIAGLVG